MPHLRLAAAQLNTVVGDLSGNVERILAALAASEAAGADICVVPELAIPGYPPEDLLLKPGFVADNLTALEKVAAATRRCAVVVGFVGAAPGGVGLANAAAVCAGGRVVGVYRKRFLPNYGVFDEQRWFVPSDEPPPLFGVAGALVGVSICEDVWFDDGPVAQAGRAGADVVVNLNASPYNRGRRGERLAMLSGRVAEAGCAIAYVNQVGGQDELVFDGDSLIVAADGSLIGSGLQFAEDLVVVDLPIGAQPPRAVTELLPRIAVTEPGRTDHLPLAAVAPRPALSDHAEVYAALVLGTRDYLRKNGFTEAVIGLSGGIDSSLVATVAVDALGASRVHGISMPSRYSSEGSRDDASALAERLGIDLKTVSIEEAHVAFSSMLAPLLGREPFGLTDENLQSRLRGVLLMAVSNAKGWIVLTTGNKSEMATGYSTLYGDSAGGFAVIKDVPKTLVYELCRYRNTQAVLEGLPGPIPDSVLDKPPSAELRPDQRDDQSLPPYEELDPVLQGYVEGDRTAADLVAGGFRPVRRGPGGAPGRRRGVQATPDASRRPHHDQGLRQGPAHAHHEPLPVLGRRGVGGFGRWLRRRSAAKAWRGIDELAELVGVYCWVENRIFEICGAWASAPDNDRRSRSDDPDPALRVWCAAVSRRHGLLAARWAERLPVRAGVDAAALVAAPPGPLPDALDALGTGADLSAGVAALVQTVLPRLQAVYAAHGHTATPVSEAPVLEVLAAAQRVVGGEVVVGRALVEGTAEGLTRDAVLGEALERAFAATSVFPAVPTS